MEQHKKRWYGINERCYSPKAQRWEHYGGRGITNFWRDDFKGFQTYLIEVLGDCPEGYSLDRIDNDGNYEPGNLRWASPREQAHNRGERAAQPTTEWKWVHRNPPGWQGSIKQNKKRYITKTVKEPATAYLQVLALRSLLRP